MRKTMRSPKDDEARARRSSHTSTRTSTSPAAAVPMTQPRLLLQEPTTTTTTGTWQAHAETIVRGAARTAFTHHHDEEHEPPRTTTRRIAIAGVGVGAPRRLRRQPPPQPGVPVSAPDPGSHPHGARAAGLAKAAAKPVSAAGTAPGQGQQVKESGKQEKKKGEEQQEEGMGNDEDTRKGNGREEKRKGTEKGGQEGRGDGGRFEVRCCVESVVVMLARVVGAYWQVVSPVFDGESEVRKRIDKAQTTRGDVVVCVLAVVFLFLAVSAGVWAVKGIVWMVRLSGRLGVVLQVVAGLRD